MSKKSVSKADAALKTKMEDSKSAKNTSKKSKDETRDVNNNLVEIKSTNKTQNVKQASTSNVNQHQKPTATATVKSRSKVSKQSKSADNDVSSTGKGKEKEPSSTKSKSTISKMMNRIPLVKKMSSRSKAKAQAPIHQDENVNREQVIISESKVTPVYFDNHQESPTTSKVVLGESSNNNVNPIPINDEQFDSAGILQPTSDIVQEEIKSALEEETVIVDDIPELEPTSIPPSQHAAIKKQLAKIQEQAMIISALKEADNYTVVSEMFDSDAIDHKNFADQFIQEVKYEPEKLFLNEPEITKSTEIHELDSTNLQQVDPIQAAAHKDFEAVAVTEKQICSISSSNSGPMHDSLKIVYSKPEWPHQLLLAKKLDKLSSLRNLMLDDSKLLSLRELGSCLPNLITLSVLRCGLTSLDGSIAIPNLENLFAADNEIRSVAPLAFISKLKYADLSGNKICSYDGFQYLGMCSQLRCMKLVDTEIAQQSNFHTYLKHLIPSLRDLHPKISTIHGKDLFTVEEENPTDDTTVEYFDELRGKSFNYFIGEDSSSTELPSSSSFLTNPTTTATEADIDVMTSYEDAYGKQLDKNVGQEMSKITELMDLRETEKKLKQVYRPEKWNFKKRGTSRLVPYSIEEMDALLEDLDSYQCESGRSEVETVSNNPALLSTDSKPRKNLTGRSSLSASSSLSYIEEISESNEDEYSTNVDETDPSFAEDCLLTEEADD